MKNTVKKKIVAIVTVIIIAIQFLLLLYSPVYSCVTQNPKLLYYAICYQLEHNNDTSFHGKINSVITGFQVYASLKPLDLGFTKNDVELCWIDLWGYIQRKLGIIYFYGIDEDMIYLDNGHLEFIGTRSSMTNTIPLEISSGLYREKFQKIYQYLSDRNIESLYIVFPGKLHQRTVLPFNLPNIINQTASEVVLQLKESNIPAVNSQDLFKDEPEVHYGLFYKGDHHWKPEYAYRVYVYISQELEKQHSPLVKYFDRTGMTWNDYYIENRLPPFHRHLGSCMRRVGRYYLPEQDITPYMIPRKETNFTFQVPSMDINKTGSVNDTFLDFYRDEPIEIIINNRVNNKNKIMVFHNSFIHSFAPFLAANNHYLYMIDMRHYHGNIADLIDQEKPDSVIFAYSGGMPILQIKEIEQQIQEKQKLNNTSKND